MRRKSVLLAVGIPGLLVVVAGAALLLLRYEPRFYREAEQPPGPARKKHAGEFYTQFSLLRTALLDSREWSAQFTDEQINACLVEGFRTSDDEETDKVLPSGVSQPRISIEADRLRIGFRYGSGFWSSVISIDLRVWVAPGESNVVALQLKGMRAGAVPISAQSLLEHVLEAARRQNVEVTWYRHEGSPVALLRFQGRRSRTTVQLEHLELHPGKLLIQGRSVEPAPVRISLPAAP
jgi:hypothetical protein